MPVRHLTISTATGNFGPVDFGEVHRHAAIVIQTASTAHTVTGNVQGSIGGSSNWNSLISLTTANSTGAYLHSTGLPFDKLRISLSANLSTASQPAWLAASD